MTPEPTHLQKSTFSQTYADIKNIANQIKENAGRRYVVVSDNKLKITAQPKEASKLKDVNIFFANTIKNVNRHEIKDLASLKKSFCKITKYHQGREARAAQVNVSKIIHPDSRLGKLIAKIISTIDKFISMKFYREKTTMIKQLEQSIDEKANILNLMNNIEKNFKLSPEKMQVVEKMPLGQLEFLERFISLKNHKKKDSENYKILDTLINRMLNGEEINEMPILQISPRMQEILNSFEKSLRVSQHNVNSTLALSAVLANTLIEVEDSIDTTQENKNKKILDRFEEALITFAQAQENKLQYLANIQSVINVLNLVLFK